MSKWYPLQNYKVKDSPPGKEADTYKIGTVANSTSTMHKIQSKPITIDMFEIDDYSPFPRHNINVVEEHIIPYLEYLRTSYLKLKEVAEKCPEGQAKKDTEQLARKAWKELIRWLPESWLQTRTMTMNYENLYTICHQRAGHKLTEWQSFMTFAKSLPYAQEFIFFEKDA